MSVYPTSYVDMLSQQFSAVYHNATTTWGVSPFHFLAG